jgi:prophage regulatory protein
MSNEASLSRRTLRVRRVAEKTGLAESSIWRLSQRGQFPSPIKLSPGATAWYEHEIDEWLDHKGSNRPTFAARSDGDEWGGSL